MGSNHNPQNYVDRSPLISALSEPWNFLCPTERLRSEILDTAKFFVDSLAVSVSDSQTIRQRNSRKRKRGDDQDTAHILRLRQLHIEGFAADQIWEQALRILDATDRELRRDCTKWAHSGQKLLPQSSPGVVNFRTDSDRDNFTAENGSTFSDSEDISDESEPGSEQDEPKHEAEAEDVLEDGMSVNGLGTDESDNASGDDDGEDTDDKHGTYVADRFGLNDGFFSIDDFNQQTEFLERQDARGGLNDESDEDEINWDVNPLSATGFSASGKQAHDSESEVLESDDEDDGPTFDNQGAEDDSDMDEDDTHAAALGGAGFINTSDIMYADFFAPPPRKASTKKSRPLPKTQPHSVISDKDVDRAMADARRDLFDDEISADGSEHETGNSRDHKSTHEKQRARIADEIRRLEAANVAKKEWMVSGEARAAERPVNSLIEEDLDFERIGKPAPVVTNELSESIEELIKRRIIAKEFDEVIRRRPGLPDRQSIQKARVELEDRKPQQSLAELYEKDHLQATDANYVDPQKQKLSKEHGEVIDLWKEISSQLDTLSNWHYKPKAPQASINVVTDVATITMEDARPTASGAVRTSALLAPHELYTPGETTKATGEVVMRNGVPVTREEMTREEKAKLRRRQKKLNHSLANISKQRSGSGVEKQQIVSDLKKGGVKLIGKGGELTDISGDKVANVGDRNGAHAMKL